MLGPGAASEALHRTRTQAAANEERREMGPVLQLGEMMRFHS